MTDWINWNGGECPIKSDKTRMQYKCRDGYQGSSYGFLKRWSHTGSLYDVIAYRIIEDHEPMPQTRDQIKAQIEALQKQLDAMPKPERRFWGKGYTFTNVCGATTHYFDIETINDVPHIHGVAMKEVDK